MPLNDATLKCFARGGYRGTEDDNAVRFGVTRLEESVSAAGPCNEMGQDPVEVVLAGKATALYACRRVTYTGFLAWRIRSNLIQGL
jgi:hypothetical protein